MGIFDDFDEDGKVIVDKPPSTKNSNLLEKRVSSLVSVYSKWVQRNQNGYESTYTDVYNSLDQLVLSAPVIEHFCTCLPVYENEKGFEWSGIFLSAAVQRGFDLGENKFTLKLTDFDTKLRGVARYLVGERYNHLRLDVIGDISGKGGTKMNYCNVTLHGSVGGDFGDAIKNCHIKVTDSVGMNFTKNAKNSIVSIGGIAGDYLGSRARGSVYTVDKDAGRGCAESVHRCRFTFNGDVKDRCGRDARYSHFMFKGTVGFETGSLAAGSLFYSNRHSVLRQIQQKAVDQTCGFFYVNPRGETTPIDFKSKIMGFFSRW